MADILQDFPIAVPPARVYEAVSTPSGLDAWWTLTCSGEPEPGAEYALGFGPSYRERGHGRPLRLSDPAAATDRRGQCRAEPLARRDQNRTERHRRGMGQEHDGCRNQDGWSRRRHVVPTGAQHEVAAQLSEREHAE